MGGVVTSSSTVNTVGSGFNNPEGVAVDSSGNVYVADYSNSAVKEIVAGTGGAAVGTVNSSSTVNTLGSGFNHPGGVAVNASGDVFVGDSLNNAVKEIVTGALNFGSAAVAASTPPTETLTFYFDTGGTIAAPAVLTQGATGLDFTDAGTGTCTTNGTSHSYSAGNTCTVVATFKPTRPGQRLGAVQLVGSGGAVIATEDVYGTGTGPQVNFSMVSGTSPSLVYGPATPQSTLGSGFLHPTDVAVDGSGNVYVADYGNISNGTDSALYEIPAGNGTPRALGSGFSEPIGVAVDGAGNVYVGDTGHREVKEILAVNGSIPASPTIVPLGGNFAFVSPKGVAVDASGNVYVGDDGIPAVYELSPNCTSSACVTKLGGSFFQSSANAPQGVAVDGSGNVYVADYNAAAVFEMSPNCMSSVCVTNIGSSVFSGNNNVNNPTGIAVGGTGNVYVADVGTNEVYEILAVNGSIPASPTINTLASGFTLSQGVAVDSRGNVYVADNSTVDELDYSDPPSLSFAATLANSTSSDSPKTVTISNIGNATLTFPLPTTGRNPSVAANFAWDNASTCTQTSTSSSTAYTLAAGASCNAAIDFTPTSLGSITGSAVLTDTNLNASPSTTQSIGLSGTATVGPLTKFAISGPNPAPFYTAFSITITAQDAYGNTVTSFNGTVNLSSSDPGFVNLGPVTLTNGVATATIGLKTAGTDSVTATDAANPLIAGTTNFTVYPGTATRFGVSAPSSAFLGGVASVTVTAYDLYGNVATGYTGTMGFTSSDAKATLPGSYTFTGGDAGAHTFTVKFGTVGSQTVTATDTSTSSITGTSGGTTVAIPTFVVNTTTDDATGVAANCPANPSTTGAGNCGLRDALAAALATGSGNITFDSTVFAASNSTVANTITLTSGGTLTIPSNTTITGPTTGSGATLTNLVTVSGGGSSSDFPVFTINSGVTAAAIANLNITNGYTTGNGGGIYNNGTLTVTSSTFANNSAGEYGGGIYNVGTLRVTGSTFSDNTGTFGGAIINYSGTLTVTGSTFANNSAGEDAGGIYNNATLTLTNSTIAGNSATYGGGIYLGAGTATIANDILSGNTATSGADCIGFCPTSDSGGNIIGVSNNATINSAAVDLAPLGSYGGPTQIMIPLPGSAAICAGLVANIPSGVTTDQRGEPNTNTTYADYTPPSAACVDAGAVQTNYALNFTAQQPSNVAPGTAMSPAPIVTLTESGTVFTAGSGTVSMSDAHLDLNTGSSTTSVATSASNGQASFGNLIFTSADTGDTLTASLVLDPTLSPVPVASAASSSFNVSQISQSIAFTAPASPVTFATGLTITLAATGGASGKALVFSIDASSTGTGSISGDVLTVTGAGTLVIDANQAGNTDYAAATQVTQSVVVNQATQTITFTPPTSPVTYGVAPITLSATGGASGDAIVFSVVSGPGSISGSTLTVTGAGTVVVAANQLGNTNYTAATQVTKSIVVNQASQSITGFAPTTPVTYGVSPFTLTATGGASGNAVTFSVVSGPGSISGSTLTVTGAGTIVVAANQSGNANYTAATQIAASIAVNKATATVALGSLSPTYNGSALAATATTNPTGLTVTFTYNGNPTAPTFTGSYTVVGTINDPNYQGSSTGTLIIGNATLTILANNASRSYGTANPTFTGSITGQKNGDTFSESFTTTATSTSSAGSYTIVPAATGTNLADYTQTITNGTLTVTLASSATLLTTSTATPYQAITITLTATVSDSSTGSTGSPTGTVSFYDGATLLGTSTMTAGVATLSTAALPIGASSVTAVYSGDTNFAASTSSGVAETVSSADFTFTLVPSSGSPAVQTVTPGGSATYIFTVSPSLASFPQLVTFTVTGLPPGATYTLTPSSIAAGGGATVMTLVVTTVNPLAQLSRHDDRWMSLTMPLLLLLPFAGVKRVGDVVERTRRRTPRLLLMVLLLAGILGTLTGCGSGGFFGTAQQTYNIVVTATSGQVSHTQSVTLTVQ
ncbi:MAG: MBG domain-containing protein [Acidobacteriaceae bacterium]